MTTPPDTPKPPSELWVDIYGGIDTTANEGPTRLYAAWPIEKPLPRYILAPSPQESHKLAEELAERIACFRAESNGRGGAAELACFVDDHRDTILAALRSSPSEQADAKRLDWLEACIRDGSIATVINDLVVVCQHCYKHFGNGPALRTAIDGCRPDDAETRKALAAIAASGGAKGDGNG